MTRLLTESAGEDERGRPALFTALRWAQRAYRDHPDQLRLALRAIGRSDSWDDEVAVLCLLHAVTEHDGFDFPAVEHVFGGHTARALAALQHVMARPGFHRDPADDLLTAAALAKESLNSRLAGWAVRSGDGGTPR